MLAQMAAAGDHWAVIEATSHALDQQRVDGLSFDLAVFTRITHEHLEYHHTIDGYVAAKARLADLVEQSGSQADPGTLVLNAADPHTATIRTWSAAAAKFPTGAESVTCRAGRERMSFARNRIFDCDALGDRRSGSPVAWRIQYREHPGRHRRRGRRRV